MASDGTTPSDDEGQGECILSGLMICPFPEGNSTEFPYPLSIHGADMLERGINDYAQYVRHLHETGGEDAGYCRMMTDTAITQAEKLRAWVKQVAPDYLEVMIQSLDELLQNLASQSDHFKDLEWQEEAGRKIGDT